MPASVSLIPRECAKQDQAVADGFGKSTQKVWGKKFYPPSEGVCLGDAIELVVTDREKLAGEQATQGPRIGV